MAFTCPHCGGQAKTRSSRQMSHLTRESYYQCEDLACGHVFKVLAQVTHTIVASANPNPRVLGTIPLSPFKRTAADACLTLVG